MPDSARLSVPRVDEANECIWWGDRRVDLAPKAFRVLRRLMQQPNQLVTKNDLLDAVWPDTHVGDGVLMVAINQLREAFGDDSRQPRFIETVHRRGYRWIGKTSTESSVLSPEFGNILSTQASGLSTPLVGRDAAMAQFEHALSCAVDGHRQMVFVTGEPGIGKTTAVNAFVARLRETESYMLAYGQCVDGYGASEAYMPLLEAVERLCREAASAEPVKLLRRLAPMWLLQFPRLLKAGEQDALHRKLAGATAERMVRELLSFVEEFTADHPLVLVLEDLHWSDHATMAALAALATRREPARLLMIATYRPVDAIAQQHPIAKLKHELTTKGQCTAMALDGLTTDAVGAYLAGRFPNHRLPPELATRLQAQTSGNPLFLLNALDDFVHRGWLVDRGDAWECMVDVDTLTAAVPDGTREMIAFRLQQLSAADLDLLEAASVIGSSFATQTLAAALERDPADVEAACTRLARAEQFLAAGQGTTWPDGSRGVEHAFRHALYRQVLYAGVTPTRRQQLHQRIAARLESGYGARAGEIAGPLSFHWEHADEMLRAAKYLEALVLQTYSRRATHEAEALAAHAVVLLKRLPPSEENRKLLLQATIGYGIALGTSRGVGSVEVEQVFSDARALGQSFPTSDEHLMSMASLALGAMMSGRLQEARRVGEELRAMAGPDAPPLVAICAHMTLGNAWLYLGDVGVSIEHLHHGRALLEKAPFAKAPSTVVLHGPRFLLDTALGIALTLAGHSERGWTLIMAALEFAKTMEFPWFRVIALASASLSAIIRADLALAKQWSTELLAYSETHGLAFWPELQRIHLAWAAVVETRDPARLGALVKSIDDFRTIGHLVMPRAFGLLADAYLCVGRPDDASRALEEAFDPRWEEQLYYAQLWRQRAAVELARPAKGKQARRTQYEEAERALTRAVEIAETQGARLFSLRATLDLCRLWQAAGKVDAARQQLSAAIARCEEGFAEVDLRIASELLTELTGDSG